MNHKKLAKAVVFIDGSNFYHGMKNAKITPTGLNYETMSRKLTDKRDWVETRFYIGQLKQEGNTTLYKEQRQFLSRLEKYNRMQIFLGRMDSHPIKNSTSTKLNRWLNALSRRPDISIHEDIVKELRQFVDNESKQYVEKAVDVMIATDMVSMAYKEEYDVAYLLSADSDFVPAIKEVRKTGRKVFVVSAMPGYEISNAANAFIHLKPEFFHGCWE